MSRALVPVKSLTSAKSRLLPELARDQLESLSLAMLRDVVEALQAAPSVGRVAVVTPDRVVAACADSLGAEPLLLEDPGLNPSIEAAVQHLSPAPAEPLLVMLGDVAGAVPEDIEALFDVLRAPVEKPRAGRPSAGLAVLAPSSDGGTSALLRQPHDAIPARFGPASARAHRDAAARAGAVYAEVPVPSLAIDLDHPEDIELFLKTQVGGRHTRALLRHMRWGQ
jgi:2-phospho-L-lactate guanylyltransferase